MLLQEAWMEVRQLYEQGLSISEIAKRLRIDRKTARKYAKNFEQPCYHKRPITSSLLDPYKDYIKNRLEQYDLSAERLYKEIKQQNYLGSYNWLAHYVAKVKKEYRTQAIMRFETLPGEQSQVDWGYLGEIYDQNLNRTIKIHCFFMILGYSRMLYAEVFENMRLENFLLGHNNAFSYFKGYTREILYDNLKSVVIKRALLAKHSEFNKKFMDFAGFYGFKPSLCRPYKPNTKGKIENSVNFVKQNFYKGKEFSSMKSINTELKIWLHEISNRNHGTTHEKPIDRLNKETLIKLDNKNLYDLTPIYWRKVTRDSFINYDGNLYSVPYKYAGKEVVIRSNNDKNIDIIYRQEVIATHVIATGTHNVVRKSEHFEGLLELRCKHRLRKPTKLKNFNTFNPIKPIKYNDNIIINSRELSFYE